LRVNILDLQNQKYGWTYAKRSCPAAELLQSKIGDNASKRRMRIRNASLSARDSTKTS